MLTIYPACFFEEEDGGYSVIFPDLENGNLATCGDDLEDAMMMAIDCLAGYIYSAQLDGDIIPTPSSLSSVNIRAIEDELYEEGCPRSPNSFVNMVSVDVAAYAKEHFEKSVKKTLTIPAWLNQKALEQNINFSQVLQEALLAKLML